MTLSIFLIIKRKIRLLASLVRYLKVEMQNAQMGLNRANTRQYSATAQPSMSRKDVRSVPPMQPTSMMYGIDMRDHLAACFYPELIHIQKTNTNTPNVNS